ncbi:hypothetical protein ES703_01254 [subsurface metagenome]|nr:T9SS type A sorting domain-containing protein [bacterium]
MEVEMKFLILLAMLNLSGGEGGEVTSEEWVGVSEASEQVFDEDVQGSDTTFADCLEVYPQPAHDVLFVALNYSFGGEVHLELFDVLGCSIYKEVFDGPRTLIDVSHFQRGVYFLSARIGESRRVIRRVIIY